MSEVTKIKCIDGPAREHRVHPAMGQRWPWVMAFDPSGNYLLTWYELDEERGGYVWTEENESGNLYD